MLLGWGRAILLQLAHPLIAAGVYEHSAFRARPWSAASRLHATVRAMLALTFGTDAQREHALHGIRTIHRRVNGRLEASVGPFPAGTPYSAEDPELVLWVHLTLLDSIPLVYELFVGPLTAEERDAYCDEAAWVALALGAHAEDVPRTWPAVRARMQRTLSSGAITVGPQARQLAAAVLAPRAGWIVPPALWVNQLVTTGLLPDEVRRQYGFPWDARRQLAFERVVRGVRALRQRAPRPLALWPEARG
jgi:uncharacterized protein (DUF2236 family)